MAGFPYFHPEQNVGSLGVGSSDILQPNALNDRQCCDFVVLRVPCALPSLFCVLCL